MKSQRSKSELLSAAYHEAGHALADYALGFRVGTVTIVPDAEASGRSGAGNTRFITRLLRQIEIGPVNSRLIARAHDLVLVLMAGGEAQGKHSAKTVRPYMLAGDRAGIVDILCRLHAGKELRAVHRYLRIRAKNMISRPMHWRMIEDLASLLLERGTLTGPDVAEAFVASGERLRRKATTVSAPPLAAS